MPGKSNYQSTRKEVEGRTFLLEFWNERGGLPVARVSEIITTETKPRWFWHKGKTVETAYEIASAPVLSGRPDWARLRIEWYLDRERRDEEELQQIEKFCKGE